MKKQCAYRWEPIPVFAIVCGCLMLAWPGDGVAVADELYDKVHATYRDLETYDATMHLRIEQREGRWMTVQAADFHVRYDRASDTLLVDKPEMVVRWQQGRLQLSSGDFPDRFLDMELDGQEGWERVLREVPMLRQPPLIDAALIRAREPVAAFTAERGLTMTSLPPASDDPLARPRLATRLPQGTLVLWIDPATNQVVEALFDYDSDAGNADESLRILMRYDVHRWNEPLDPDSLALDLADRTAFDSLSAMLQSGSRPAATAPQGPARHPVIGGQAPDFESIDLEVRPFALKDLTEPLVIIEFWTTWSRNTLESLQDLRKVADWIEAEKLPVAIMTVNVGQTLQQAKIFMERHPDLDLPVVVDPNYEISEKFHVQSVPAIVIIHEGVVVEIITGHDPATKVGLLREQVRKHLARSPE